MRLGTTSLQWDDLSEKQNGRDGMNEAEMKAELERLRAENAKLKSKTTANSRQRSRDVHNILPSRTPSGKAILRQLNRTFAVCLPIADEMLEFDVPLRDRLQFHGGANVGKFLSDRLSHVLVGTRLNRIWHPVN